MRPGIYQSALYLAVLSGCMEVSSAAMIGENLERKKDLITKTNQ